MPGRQAKFKAVYPYEPGPSEEGDMAICDGDEILVDQKEWGNDDFKTWLNDASRDWIVGTNVRTGLKGMFPGNYVQFVELIEHLLPPTPLSSGHVNNTIPEDSEGSFHLLLNCCVTDNISEDCTLLSCHLSQHILVQQCSMMKYHITPYSTLTIVDLTFFLLLVIHRCIYPSIRLFTKCGD